MEKQVTFPSDGLALSGILHIPDDLEPGEKRPALMILHGFGSNKMSQAVIQPARTFCKLGYVTLRFDMRGLGESEGKRAHVLCLDQVQDTSNALTYLQSLTQVDGKRIGCVGHSFGAAVALYAGGVDDRMAAVISSGGWGDGERKFKGQHATPEAWARFTGLLEQGRAAREKTGETMMIGRYDIVPIPEHLRGNLAEGSIMAFPVDTAQSMLAFKADDVVGKIAPRPLLLLHSATDSVTPAEQSVELFKRAGQPTELHMMTGVDHFMFNTANARVTSIVEGWLGDYFPVQS